jgi:hypothetical protein
VHYNLWVTIVVKKPGWRAVYRLYANKLTVCKFNTENDGGVMAIWQISCDVSHLMLWFALCHAKKELITALLSQNGQKAVEKAESKKTMLLSPPPKPLLLRRSWMAVSETKRRNKGLFIFSSTGWREGILAGGPEATTASSHPSDGSPAHTCYFLMQQWQPLPSNAESGDGRGRNTDGNGTRLRLVPIGRAGRCWSCEETVDVREWHFLPASCQAEEQIAVEVVAEESVVPTTNLIFEKGDASLSLSHVLSFGCVPHGHHQRCSHMEGAPFHHASLGKNSGVSD